MDFEKELSKYCSDASKDLFQYLETLPISNDIDDTIINMCGDDKQVLSLIKQYKAHKQSSITKKLRKQTKLAQKDTSQKLNSIQQATRIGDSKNGDACECQAQLHPLLTSCQDCGRVICTAESLPCVFCKSNKTHTDIHTSRDKVGSKEEAEEMRVRLLGYAKDGTERTKVHDIAGDFADSLWDSDQVKALKLEKKNQSIAKMGQRRENIITIDLGNRKILQDDRSLDIQNEEIHSKKEVSELEKKVEKEDESKLVVRHRNPYLNFDPPTFIYNIK